MTKNSRDKDSNKNERERERERERESKETNLYPCVFEHLIFFTFHYQLMHLLIKTLSQFTFKTTHVKNVCDA